MTGRRACGWRATEGATLLEVLLAAAFVVLLAGLAVPLTAQAADSARARSAASFVAARLRLARAHAVTAHQAAALVFDQVDTRWVFRRCSDGNGNGVRRAEIGDGRDVCLGREELGHQFSGVALGLDAGIPDLDGDVGETAAVRFGRSAMASCTPLGHCTPGTVYLRSGRGQQFAIRVSGVTGRTRLLRFDQGTRRWTTD
jgi:type II secretory pathway pseudopilin PulG